MELVKAADDLAAFREANLALQNGISNAQLQAAVTEKQLFYRTKTIAGVDFDKFTPHFVGRPVSSPTPRLHLRRSLEYMPPARLEAR